MAKKARRVRISDTQVYINLSEQISELDGLGLLVIPQGCGSKRYDRILAQIHADRDTESAKHREIVEILAVELHRNFRAAEKALNRRAKTVWRKGKEIPNPNLLLHDHGFGSCGKQLYFRRRAELILARANDVPATLGEMEAQLASMILKRRIELGCAGKATERVAALTKAAGA
jgi:hypothetical protein